MKLNIGDAGKTYDGYIGIDISRGQDAANLEIHPDCGPIDEIRVSHVLEHFPRAEVRRVLQGWVEHLQPGGVLKIAVPDLKVIAEQYLAGAQFNVQGYLMGGQVNQHDFHKVIFDEEILTETLREVGLIGIRRWEDDIDDCSRLPISLNLAGTKPYDIWPKAHAVVSMPRLGFNDFWECACAYLKFYMPVRRITGCFWDAQIEQGIDEAIAESQPDWIMTADYDSLFDGDTIMGLLDLAARHPEADAIAPIQVSRGHDSPMWTARAADGTLVKQIDRNLLTRSELYPSETAHFGLTLLRVSKLKELPKPWFFRRYGAEKCDPDVSFWHHWKAHGNTLFTATRFPIGHCELMVRWPDVNLEAMMQRPGEFFKTGKPERVWR